MAKKLEFGLQPPRNATVAWGARAIFSRRRGIELVFNRQDAFGSEAAKQELFRWMDTVGMPALREATDALDPGSDETVEIELDDYTIRASPRRSHGYLYIVAWKSGPKEWSPAGGRAQR